MSPSRPSTQRVVSLSVFTIWPTSCVKSLRTTVATGANVNGFVHAKKPPLPNLAATAAPSSVLPTRYALSGVMQLLT